MHEVWRSVERREVADGSVSTTSMAITQAQAVRELLELVAALGRRVPQVQRAGEASIARDAAALRWRALKRIEELEHEASPPAFARFAGFG